MNHATKLVATCFAGATVAGAAFAVVLNFPSLKGNSEPESSTASVPTGPVGSAVVIGSRLDWPSVDALLAASDVVAVVRWVGDREETVGLPSVDGTVLDSRIDVVREFRTVEVLKGAALPTEFEASTTRTNTFVPRPNIPQGATLHQEVIELNRNDTYVVFLRQAAGGEMLFIGEPSLARIDADRLHWMVSSDYVSDKARTAVSLGNDGATQAFDGQSVESIRQRLGVRP